MNRWLWAGLSSLGAHVILLGSLSGLRVAVASVQAAVTMRLAEPPPPAPPPPPPAPKIVPVQVAPKRTRPEPLVRPEAPPPEPVPEVRTEVAPAALPGPAEPAAGTGPAAGSGAMLGEPQGTAVEKPPPEVKVDPAAQARARSDLAGYHRQVYAQMMAARRYPPAARRLGLEGRVVLSVRIDRRGRVVGAPRVLESSKHDILDEEALRLAAAGEFPPLPASYLEETADFQIPIRFRLTD